LSASGSFGTFAAAGRAGAGGTAPITGGYGDWEGSGLQKDWGNIMSEMILSSGLFTGEPVETFVCFNENEVAMNKALREAWKSDPQGAEEPEEVEPQGAYFNLLPVDGFTDAEYTKKRGQDKHSMKIAPRGKGETGPAVRFETMEISFSNEQEIRAMVWLAEKVVKGWRGIRLETGEELEFSPVNLTKLASVPSVIRPIIASAYELGNLRKTLSEGN
jgi:hypothetical protein